MAPSSQENNLHDKEDSENADLSTQEPYAVVALDWDGPRDPGNPRNFSNPIKVLITGCLATLVCLVTFGSSVMSPASDAIIQEFGISEEVSILVTSLFVLGFSLGPMLFGPASEVLGRKYPLSLGAFLFSIFSIPVAVAQNVVTIFVCRFLSGLFGAALLAVAGGILADIWDPLTRGIAVAGFASTTFLGPVLGPIVGGFVTESHLGWRWTQWLTIIFSLFFFCVYFFFCPETYSCVLLARRAKKQGLVQPGDEERTSLRRLARLYILKPWIMIIQEPILALVTLYMSFIYGVLYLCLEAYPITFQKERHWSLGVGSLPFLAITVGVLLGVVIIIAHTKTRMKRKLQTSDNDPEERLVPMMLGSILLPIGMFWFAWTSNPNITWVPQVVSGICIGCGILLIFMQGLNYIIDVYKLVANSAISINAFFRGLLGAGFPLFASYMFNDLGVAWSMSLLGFICVALVPVPFLFYIYGVQIRKWSKFIAV